MITARITVNYDAVKGIGFWTSKIAFPEDDCRQITERELSGKYINTFQQEIELLAVITTLSLIPEGNEFVEVSSNSTFVLQEFRGQYREQKKVDTKNNNRINDLFNILFYLSSRRNISWSLTPPKGSEKQLKVPSSSQENNLIPKSENTKFIAYTDGSCLGNPGNGGWGVVVEARSQGELVQTYEFSGSEPNTTNNRMELTGAIKVLENLPENSQITINTDSKYLYDGITGWIKNWKAKHWHTSAGKPVLNKDLWQWLDELTSQHRVKWNWVKGHHVCDGNIQADLLATTAAKQN